MSAHNRLQRAKAKTPCALLRLTAHNGPQTPCALLLTAHNGLQTPCALLLTAHNGLQTPCALLLTAHNGLQTPCALEPQRNRDHDGAAKRIGQATIRVRFGPIEIDAVSRSKHVLFRLIVYRERAFEHVHELGAVVGVLAYVFRITPGKFDYVRR